MGVAWLRSGATILAALTAMLLSWPVRADVVVIDNAGLVRLMGQGVPLIDIRTPAEWRSTGVIAGSRAITFFDERGQANPSAWLAEARRVAPSEAAVILVCRSGNRTREASRVLAEQGAFRTVYHLGKGVSGWVGEGRPLVPWR